MHRNASKRISLLESEYRQRRNNIIDRIASYMRANMTAAQHAAFTQAIERSLRDGEEATYTQAESNACARFDELARARPDILKLIESMEDARYVG